MQDYNDYGRFDNFYRAEPEEKKEKELWGLREPQPSTERRNPFFLDDLRIVEIIGGG